MNDRKESHLPAKGQFLVYQAEDGRLKIDVRLENETAWLTQSHMAELFQTTIPDPIIQQRFQQIDASAAAAAAMRFRLPQAILWQRESWDTASSYFWDTAVERGHFECLLEPAWREHQAAVRSNPDAFRAFKVLTMNLAAHHVPAALKIQEQIGIDGQ
jgi:hypothetical protein